MIPPAPRRLFPLDASRVLPVNWWNTRAFAIFAVLVSFVPLIWPATPPLFDLPGHIGRYHVAADIARSPLLQKHWSYEWALIGNLGVDLPVWVLTPLFGVELAAKLVVASIPPLTVAGLVWLSREGQGEVSPAAPLAFPLAYGYPFQFGFVNFTLAAALAILALAGWLRLGRQGRIGLRTLLFVPISVMLWIAHSFGWGMFGLFAFSAEMVRRRDAGASWVQAAVRALPPCAALALPLVLMVTGSGPGDGHGLGIEYDWLAKLMWPGSLLREHWKWYDTACTIVMLCGVWAAVRRRDVAFSRPLAAAAIAGFAAWLVLPYGLLAGAYVDMRMLPFAVAVLIVAIRVRPEAARLAPGIALAATAFFLMRLVTTTVSFLLLAHGQQAALRLVDAIPRGASVLVLVRSDCVGWDDARLGHIAGLALARRDIFDNSEWHLAGQQLLRSRHPEAGALGNDPSQFVFPPYCTFRPTDFAQAIRSFNRKSFDLVWTVGFPARAALAPDVVRIADDPVSTLYRVNRR